MKDLITTIAGGIVVYAVLNQWQKMQAEKARIAALPNLTKNQVDLARSNYWQDVNSWANEFGDALY